MSNNGLLIDYKYCTGCHTCEVACLKEHSLDEGQFGIQVLQVGPWKADQKWIFDYVPVLTDLCDLCESRVEEGRLPTCVHHCQSMCIEYGSIDELTKKVANDTKVAVFIPQQ
jgi:Fe-S-cluster-containing dehydrogenase component